MRTAVLGILLAFICVVAYADDYDVYFKDHRVDGAIVVRKGTFYFPVIPLAKAMGLDTGTSKTMIWVGTHPEEGTTGEVVLNGTPFRDFFFAENKTVYVGLEGFAKMFGCKVIINKRTQIIDILAEERVTDHRVYRNTMRESFDKFLPEPLLESLKEQPTLRGYLISVKNWWVKSSDDEDKAVEYLENRVFKGQEPKDLQNTVDFVPIGITPFDYSSVVDETNFFRMEVVSKGELRKTFEKIVPPKEFQESHAILKSIVERFSDYESLAEQGLRLTTQMDALTKQLADLNSQFYAITGEHRRRKELENENEGTSISSSRGNLQKLTLQILARFDPLDKQQLEDFNKYLAVLKTDLEPLLPESKPRDAR